MLSAPPARQLAVSNCNFRSNVASTGDGGAIHVPDSNKGPADISFCYFEGNQAAEARAGGISVNGANVTVDSSIFVLNSARVKGGAVAVLGEGNVTLLALTNSFFVNNSAPLGGAAIYIGMVGAADVEFCQLDGGNANLGGGIMIEDFGTLTFVSSNCTANT